MKTRILVVCGCICAALAILPAASASEAEAGKCIVRKPTAASYKWNFGQEANAAFKDIQSDAAQVRYHAERLQSLVLRADSASWVSDVNQLNQIGTAVNDMGGKLCRLEAIRRAAYPWQRKTIDRIADGVTLLADNTQDAMAFGHMHRETLWLATYRKYVDNLYAESRKLSQSVEKAVKYVKVDRQDRALRSDLNGRSS